MRKTSVICWICRELVEVVDKIIAEHGEPSCDTSGMRYLPQRFSSGPSGPKFEVLGTKDIHCSTCGGSHEGMALIRVSLPDPSRN